MRSYQNEEAVEERIPLQNIDSSSTNYVNYGASTSCQNLNQTTTFSKKARNSDEFDSDFDSDDEFDSDFDSSPYDELDHSNIRQQTKDYDLESMDLQSDYLAPIYKPTSVDLPRSPNRPIRRNRSSSTPISCQPLLNCLSSMSTAVLNNVKNNKSIYIITGIVILVTTIALIIHKLIDHSDTSTHYTTTPSVTFFSTTFTEQHLTSDHTDLSKVTSEYGTSISHTSSITEKFTDSTTTLFSTTKGTDDPRCIKIPSCCDDGVWICNKR